MPTKSAIAYLCIRHEVKSKDIQEICVLPVGQADLYRFKVGAVLIAHHPGPSEILTLGSNVRGLNNAILGHCEQLH